MAAPVDSSLETFAAGNETAVDVAQIERQLRQLWQLAAESARDEASRRITRACLFNLVAYCEAEAHRDHVTGIIREVTSRHPCRAIVLLAEHDRSADEIAASITAHCHLAGGGGKQVCCEQISIHAAGPSVARLPGAVLPLLESDLPTVLWWTGNFLERGELLRRLGGVADRVIFDSSTWPPPVPLDRLAATVTERMADLSWTRLALWQQLLAEAFDEVHCAAAADRLNRIEVVHGHGPGAELRAWLFASWLAAQLGWSVAAARDRIHATARDDTDATTVGLLSVRLHGPDVEVCVAKNYGEAAASVTVNVPAACGLPRKRALWPTDDAALLCQELDRATAAPALYRRALEIAAELRMK
jgi:glucose-6-phosphate dehydrogenase assembly protein OpcA